MSAGNAAQSPEHHKSPNPGTRWRRALQIAAGLFAAYLLGFIVFVARIDHTEPAEPAASDAIVALTGGPERIQVAFQLLEQKKGGRLLISGVHPEVTKNTLNALIGDAGGVICPYCSRQFVLSKDASAETGH